MGTWKECLLGDIVTFQRGYDLPKTKMNGGIYPVVASNGIIGYHDKFTTEEPSITIGRSGSVGKPLLVKGKSWSHNTTLYIKEYKGVDPFFVYYFLKTLDLQNYAGGSAVPTLNRNHIHCLPVKIPVDISEQKKIASVLSAYDDLIENNQKQIQLLEEISQRLYKEWFVKLHFPDYENTPVIDGVPKGWKIEKLVDIADVQYGYAFNGSFFNSKNNGTPIMRIRNIPNGTTNDYTTEKADKQYLVSNGDIVVGMDGEFHINSWSGDTAYLVQRTCKLSPKNSLMKGWLLQAIYEPIKYFEKTVLGATVSHLGKKHIDTITLLTAPDELYQPFQIYFQKRQLLLNQNLKLSEARDRLLPELMNGKIDVSKVRI